MQWRDDTTLPSRGGPACRRACKADPSEMPDQGRRPKTIGDQANNAVARPLEAELTINIRRALTRSVSVVSTGTATMSECIGARHQSSLRCTEVPRSQSTVLWRNLALLAV